MKKLIAYFIKYPIYANAIIIITVIAGILSFIMMPKSFFPELSPNKIYVNVSYPGASPEEIEEGITTLDSSLGGLGGCPAAPGASGNIVTEDLVFMLEAMGLTTGIDLSLLLGVRDILSEALPNECLYGFTPNAGLPKGFHGI